MSEFTNKLISVGKSLITNPVVTHGVAFGAGVVVGETKIASKTIKKGKDAWSKSRVESAQKHAEKSADNAAKAANKAAEEAAKAATAAADKAVKAATATTMVVDKKKG